LTTWLHRILHNLAVSQVRRSREMATEDVEDAAETRWRDGSYTVDATVVVERAEAREELQDALARLPVIYRSTVILRDVEEMIVAAIAEVQGCLLPSSASGGGRMMLVTGLARGRERQVALSGVLLRCWDARGRISDYLYNELEPEGRALLERHPESCPDLSAAVYRPGRYSGSDERAARSWLRRPCPCSRSHCRAGRHAPARSQHGAA
jgi:RNA polymerase sigma-70 factor (ECF subfamily)